MMVSENSPTCSGLMLIAPCWKLCDDVLLEILSITLPVIPPTFCIKGTRSIVHGEHQGWEQGLDGSEREQERGYGIVYAKC
jgi:hypothetical protein